MGLVNSVTSVEQLCIGFLNFFDIAPLVSLSTKAQARHSVLQSQILSRQRKGDARVTSTLFTRSSNWLRAKMLSAVSWPDRRCTTATERKSHSVVSEAQFCEVAIPERRFDVRTKCQQMLLMVWEDDTTDSVGESWGIYEARPTLGSRSLRPY